jgi:iron complex outermembrane receptor protein
MGASYHSNGYELAGSARISVPDLSPRDRSMSIFLQDEVAVVPDKLRLTFGAKLENNELSNRDLDVMPTVRLLWQIKKDAALWAAVTRAIRTPSYADLGAHAIDIVPAVPPGAAGNPFPVPLRVSATGTPGFGSEEITAHEMGVRGRLTPTVSYDVALYDMSYDKLRATQPADVVCNPSGTSVFANPLCLLTSDSATTELLFVNGAQGNVRGAELAADWDARDNWRIRASYAVTRESLSAPAPLGAAATVTPRNQLNLRSEWSLRPDVRLALWLRHVGSIESMSIDDYWQANLQVNWRPKDHWQLSFGAKNLLGTRLEFISEFNDVVPTQIERRYYIAAQWRF